MNSKKEKKINYVITSEYKTECYFKEDELIKIFNEKYFKTIMKIENFFGGCNV